MLMVILLVGKQTPAVLSGVNGIRSMAPKYPWCKPEGCQASLSQIQLLHTPMLSLGWPHNDPLYGLHLAFQVFSCELSSCCSHTPICLFSRQEVWTKKLPVLPSRLHESDAVLCRANKNGCRKWGSTICLQVSLRVFQVLYQKAIFIWFSLLFFFVSVLPGQSCPWGIGCWPGLCSVLCSETCSSVIKHVGALYQ